MRNMAAPDGSFYFQRHRLWTNRTAYMRWGQAWMLQALARLLRAGGNLSPRLDYDAPGMQNAYLD